MAAAPKSESSLEDDIMAGINKAKSSGGMGPGTALSLSDGGLSIHIPGVIPTGSPWMDWALGRGGWPLSRICLVGGDEGTGKTTLAIQACAAVQAMGGVAVYLDAEFKLDMRYAEMLCVDCDKLVLMQPKCIEDAMEMIMKVLQAVKAKRLKTGKLVPVLIVYDSISALPDRYELEHGFDDKQPGGQARAMSKGLRKINQFISEEACCLLLISQLREKIGVMFGDNNQTSCGKAPRFYSACIVNLGRGKLVKDDGSSIGVGTHVYVHKNQVAPPHRKSELRIEFGEGIDRGHGLHGVAVKCGWATMGGSWTKPPPSSGIDNWNGMRDLLENRESDHDRIETAIREHYEAVEWTGVPGVMGTTIVT